MVKYEKEGRSSMAKGKYEKWLTDDGLKKLEAWARDGLIDEQIAHNMGINVSTLYDYKNKFEKISEALKKGKEVVDIEVENALFKRAVGYSYKETYKELRKNKDTGQDELIVVKEVEKNMPPDVTAQIYWLNNRKPANWKNRRYENISDNEEKETGVIELGSVGDNNE